MNRLGKRVYLYGLDERYRVIHYCRIDKEFPDFKELKLNAYRMKNEYPSIRYLYAANSSYEIYTACIDAVKNKTVEDCVLFKLLVESEGIRIY